HRGRDLVVRLRDHASQLYASRGVTQRPKRKYFCHGSSDCTVKAPPNCSVIYLSARGKAQTGNLRAAALILNKRLCVISVNGGSNGLIQRTTRVVTFWKRGAKPLYILGLR